MKCYKSSPCSRCSKSCECPKCTNKCTSCSKKYARSRSILYSDHGLNPRAKSFVPVSQKNIIDKMIELGKKPHFFKTKSSSSKRRSRSSSRRRSRSPSRKRSRSPDRDKKTWKNPKSGQVVHFMHTTKNIPKSF